MSSIWQQSRQTWMGIVLSLISLAAILLFVDPRAIWLELQTVQISYLILMVAGLVVFLIFRAVRWHFMLAAGTNWGSVFHIQNIGYMLNMTLPLRLGDMARAVLIGNVPPATMAGGISTMVVERLFDMLFVVTLLPFTLSAVSSLPDWVQEGARFFGYASIGGIFLLILAANQRPFAIKSASAILERLPRLNHKPWVDRLDHFLSGLSTLTNIKAAFILLGLSIIVWLPIIYTYFVGMRAFGLNPAAVEVGFLFCAAALSVAIPSAPGQIGVFHAGVSAAMLAMGQQEGTAVALPTVYHAVNLATMVAMGFFGLSRVGTTFEQVLNSAQKLVGK